MSEETARILVVEDEDQIRILLLRLLDQEGYTAVEARNADEALEILGRESFDLILLDLRMPGQASGEDLLFKVRDSGNDVPIVIISAWVDDDIAQNQPECVHAILKKPIRLDEFKDTVEQALALN